MDKLKRIRSLIRQQQKKQERFLVQVSYAHPDTSVVLTLHVPSGTTIKKAIELSGLSKIIKHISPFEGQVGIFGEIRSFDAIVQENDRIEIYRPLAAPPGKARQKQTPQAGVEIISL